MSPEAMKLSPELKAAASGGNRSSRTRNVNGPGATNNTLSELKQTLLVPLGKSS